jgi:hypothetical protein
MKSLVEFLTEHKEDLGSQVIMIMGTPGCGKTYWMQHNGIRFFKSQGITLNPKELDVDHTLKLFQILDFPKFCDRVLNYKNASVMNKNGEDVHNKKNAWETFLDNELERYTKLNYDNHGLDSNIPNIHKIQYDFVAPWISRYENAAVQNKEKVFDEFVSAMSKEYFNDVFASDFSVRGEAKEQYNKDLEDKIKSNSDAFVAISGAKFAGIKEISNLCKSLGVTCRIVYLNGSVEKAVGQDAKRERSGGAAFVMDYASKIERVWNKLIDPSAPEYYKKNDIYNIYEFKDKYADDILSYPTWELDRIYK